MQLSQYLKSTFLIVLSVAILPLGTIWAQEPDGDAGNDPAERKAMERFQTVLERTPRRGTALDRVYGYHVEHGSLDTLVKRYSDRVNTDKTDGPAWLLLGLLEAQRGRDAAAVAAFREAERVRADDPLPSFYLGQALVLVGQPDQAVDAFERALTKKPIRADLLEIYQALGRVHQRARRTEKALAVWTRLEASFPDDTRVREQIAAALAEENQPAQALARYEALIKDVKDEYRKIQLAMDAAELKVRLGKAPEALEDFGRLLGKLNPDSWLFKEVRRKIEEVFLRNDDLAGLAKYYEAWIAKTPDDVEAMARLGRTYAQLGRAADSRRWLDQAVKLAPSRRDLRVALIEQLVQEKKIGEAAAEYEKLAQADPGNPDIIRDWGKMLLRDTSRPVADRRAAAAAVWKKSVGDDVKDAVTLAQTADLFRQAEMIEDAIALYKRAITLAPDSAQYREYLGEYYHQLKRPADALATWRTGVGKAAPELGRLGEVLAGFGYRKEALEPLSEAVKLAPDDFDLRLKLADLYLQLDRSTDALGELVAAKKASTSPEQLEAVLSREIKAYQAGKSLGGEITKLKVELTAGKDATAERWSRLAAYHEADGKPADAILAAISATKADPKSLPAWVTVARLQEASGNLGAAAEANRTLATLDRRARADYLSAIARLEARLGRRDEALKAGRDLLAAAPGNSERAQEFAELCFSLGENDEGLETLRRSSRANPSDPKATSTLAEALARQFRTEEAIELFWRSFDRTKELDGKLAVVARLTDQYLQRNQFDRLIARLERELREPDRKRELTICLAQAYQAAGDLGAARQQLESLLSANPRDAGLLIQLASLAETEGDVASAARYQRQAVDIAPTPETTIKLAQLYVRAGEMTEAESVWSKLASSDQEASRALTAIDSLLGSGKYETVVNLTERMLLKQPNDWDMLYRSGVALQNLGKTAEATKRFQAILDLNKNDDELAAIAKSKRKGGGVAGQPAGVAATRMASAYQFPMYMRINMAQQIRSVVGLENRYYYGANYVWNPSDFGLAREAALGWLYAASLKDKNPEAWLQTRRTAAETARNDTRPLWDWYYLQLLRADNKEIFAAATKLARTDPNDPAALYSYLSSLAARGTDSLRANVVRSNNAKVDTTPALPPADLQLVLDSFESLKKRRPDLILSNILTTVNTELKRAKREGDATAFYKSAVASASTLETVVAVLGYAAEQGSLDDLFALTEKYERLQAASGKANAPVRGNANEVANTFAQAMGAKADTKDHAAILKLLDHYLAAAWKPDQVVRRQKAMSNTSTAIRAPSAFYVYVGKPQAQQPSRYVRLDFPSANSYFDQGSIQLLRNAFEVFKKDDVLTDLISRFRADATKASEDTKLFPTLALSYLLWWNEEKEEALREYAHAADLAKSDIELKLSLAELRAQRGDVVDALEAADSVEPLDQKTMQRRETLALRLSVLSGDIARARKAAERLFGLRLDGDTQVQLATQMNQLGMHELSEAVLARARRSAGGNSMVLVSLMTQYQRQGNTDLAVQVANQIMRQTGGVRNTQPGAITQNDQARAAAVQLFSRSGKMKELIARAEAQLATSPNSPQLLQTLVDYYQADNQRDKVKATYDRLAKLRADDPKALFQIALQLSRNGSVNESLELYRAALTKDSSLFANQSNEVLHAFQQAGKTDELLKLYDSMDFKTFRNNPYVIVNTIMQLMQEEKSRAQALTLFRKAWKELPDARTQLIANFYNDEFWKLPEIFDYARQAVIPSAGKVINDPWAGLDEVDSFQGDGLVNGVFSRLLQAAERQNKLDQLATDVEAAVKRSPDWTGGKALLAVIKAKKGKVQEARKDLEQILNSGGEIPTYSRMLVGQELDKINALKDIELRLYEGASADPDNMMRSNGFQYGPGRRLITLYEKNGRFKDARDLILKNANSLNNWDGYDVNYASYQRVNETLTFATMMNQIGYPADAARFYSNLANDSDSIANARQYFGNPDQLQNQIRQGMTRSLQGMNRETAERTIRTLVAPRPNAKAGDPAVDLVLLCHPREIDKTAVLCVFAESMSNLRANKALKAEAHETLVKLSQAKPDDISVLAGLAILATTDEGTDSFAAEVSRLMKAVEAHPLDALPANGRPNARQRLEAEHQLILWVVARLCLANEKTRATGELLAARALEAAKRQPDTRWSMAMLRESAQLAFNRGDKQTAEAAWRGMLKIVLSNSNPKSSDAPQQLSVTVTRPAAPVTAAIPLTKAAIVRVPGGTSAQVVGGIVVTIERFEQSVQLAKLIAEHDLAALSVEVMKQSLASGPPVMPMAIANPNSQRIIRQNTNDSATNPTAQRVEETLFELEKTWAKKKADPVAVYGVLKEAVLPTVRPGEIFLYARPLSLGNLQLPRSVGALLVSWAVKAGKADDLRQAIAAREKGPLAQAPAKILRAQLELALKNYAAVNALLDEIRLGSSKDGLAVTGEMACLVALPALDVKETAESAAKLVESSISKLETPNVDEPVGSVRLRLADHYYESARPAEGKKLLLGYLSKKENTASRYNGDYSIFLRRQELGRIALEFARHGQTADALDHLGQYDDMPATLNYGNQPYAAEAFQKVAAQLAKMPAAERYARMKAWTLPTENRKSVRWMIEQTASIEVPAPFLNEPKLGERGLVLSSSLLIDSAREIKALDVLATEVQPLVAKKIEHAADLMNQIDLARGNYKNLIPLILARATELKTKPAAANDVYGRQSPLSLTDYLLVRDGLAADNRSLNEAADQLANVLLPLTQTLQNFWMQGELRRDIALSAARRAGAPDVAIKGDPELPLWTPRAIKSQGGSTNYVIRAIWAESSGVVAHAAGSWADYLLFRYPLAGTFEVNIEAYTGSHAEGQIGYAGLVSEPSNYQPNSSIWTHGLGESVPLPSPFSRGEAFNRMTIRVEPGKVTYLVNGHMFYHENMSSFTSPWLFLHSNRERGTAFRNAVITGSPRIPREVALVQGDRLEGWEGAGIMSPRRLSQAQRDLMEERGGTNRPDEFFWRADNGELRRTRNTEVSGETGMPSLLTYVRPMENGDELTYEFFYEPEITMVHPTLGGLAFLIEPSGVRLRTLRGRIDLLSRTKEPRELDDSAGKRGEVKLQANNWNAASLRLKGKTLEISINGTKVYEREIDPSDRAFGFFHDAARTSARVRKVVLRGEWPTELTAGQMANLFGRDPSKPRDRATQAASAAVVSEKFLSLSATDLVNRTRGLPASERYEELLAWVLPNEEHTTVRLISEYAATALPVAGQLESPAIELVAAAKETGKLDALAEAIARAPAVKDVDRRGKLALMALVRHAQNKVPDATKLIGELKVLAEKTIVKETPETERWPELVIATGLLGEPKLNSDVVALLGAVVYQMEQQQYYWSNLEQHLRAVLARARLMPTMPRIARNEIPAIPGWIPVSIDNCEKNGLGLPAPIWTYKDGVWTHYPGHEHDFLFLATPLRGDFEISCELSSFGWREARVSYGGLTVGLHHELKAYELKRYGHYFATNGVIDPPLKDIKDFYTFKLVVKGNSATVFMNGRKIHEGLITRDHDPWLALDAHSRLTASVRNLKIKGQPVIPDVIPLSGDSDLTGWLGNYYGEPVEGESAYWQKRGEEIIGRQLKATPERRDRNPNRRNLNNGVDEQLRAETTAGSKVETLLRYARPLVEDAEIEYDFFHDASKTETHPALGRFAFLMQPDGVKLHRITDGKFERSTIDPGNATVIATDRRGPAVLPLKAKEWNHTKIALQGDRMTITLNGQVVYEHAIKPTDLREFGFFHFADETESRIKNVILRGSWPKTLPPELVDQPRTALAPAR